MLKLKNIYIKYLLILFFVNCSSIGAFSKDIILHKSQNPILFSSDLTISSSDKLIVYEGVILKLNPNVNIIIKGSVEFLGTQDQPIIVTSSKDNTPEIFNNFDFEFHGGIFLEKAKKCKFSNVVFKQGGTSSLTQNNQLFIYDSDVSFEYCTFINQKNKGVTIKGQSVVDFGLGGFGSIGFNIFSGFDKPRFALTNLTQNCISAKNNCWDSNSELEIENYIFDKLDKSTSEKIDFLPLAISCEPSLPISPTLLFPENHSEHLPRIINVRWSKVDNAGSYIFQYSEDSNFLQNVISKYDIQDTAFTFYSQFYGKTYYWRVASKNQIGLSQWTPIYTFSINDTAKPQIPELISPKHGTSENVCNLNLVCQLKNKPEIYQFIISSDSLLNNILIDTLITSNQFFLENCKEGNNYFWKVRARNSNGWGPYSDILKFSIANNIEIKSIIQTELKLIKILANECLFTDGNNIYKSNSINAETSKLFKSDVNFLFTLNIQNDDIEDTLLFKKSFNNPVSNESKGLNFELISTNTDQTSKGISFHVTTDYTITKAVKIDIDHDWDLDILIIGYKGNIPIASLIINDYPVLFEKSISINNISEIVDCIIYDFDNDGDYDFILTGKDNANSPYSEQFENNWASINLVAQYNFNIFDYHRNSISSDMQFICSDENSTFLFHNGIKTDLINQSVNKLLIIDLNNDRTNDIIAYSEIDKCILTILCDSDKYVKTNTIKLSEIEQLYFYDYDADQDLDIIAQSENGIVLLTNFSCNLSEIPTTPELIGYSYSGSDIILELNQQNHQSDELYEIKLVDQNSHIILQGNISECYNNKNYFGISNTNYYLLKNLDSGIYNCSIKSFNRNGISSNEILSKIIYTKGLLPLPPESWLYDKKTGINSTVIIRNSSETKLEDTPLQPGDAIGVFYSRDKEIICGGYSIYNGKENIAITVWGDNFITENFKDGFSMGEYLRFKIWKAGENREIPVAGCFIEGNNNFLNDRKYIIDKFKYLDTFDFVTIPGKTSYISSYLNLYYPYLGDITKGKHLFLKKDDNMLYQSNLSKNDFDFLDEAYGYKLYSEEYDTLRFIGQKIDPESYPIKVKAYTWITIPYLLNYSAATEKIFEEYQDKIIAIKDDRGNYYIPNQNINNLVYLAPGKAYKLLARENFDFKYNNNISLYSNDDSMSIFIKEAKMSYFNESIHYTGNDMLAILKSQDIEEGDEVAVRYNGIVFGSSIATSNEAIITIWGDNEFSNEIDGSIDFAKLEVLVFKIRQNQLKKFIINNISSIEDYTKIQALVYETDKIYLIDGKCDNYTYIADSDLNFTIYPQPAKEYLNFTNNSKDNLIQYKIFSMDGKLILKNELAPTNEGRITLNNFQKGMYIIQFISNKSEINKIIIVN